MNRTQTKQIHVGSVAIGGGAPVAVQSMCNTHTSDARATIEQIARLHDAGCEIIRLAVPDQDAADALPEIVHASPIPVVADIHFDYRLALAAAKAGVPINTMRISWPPSLHPLPHPRTSPESPLPCTVYRTVRRTCVHPDGPAHGRNSGR